MKTRLLVGLTDEAQQAMARADDEARGFHHEYIGTEHLLLALVEGGAGIGGDVLGALGVKSQQVRDEIEKLVTSGPESVQCAERPLTPRALEALDFARQEALYTCQGLVDTEHLLLGLLREPDGVAGVVLRNLGLNLEATREEVLKIRVLQMKVVERAVRPVRATSVRKRKMREELLAHLGEIYEQERAELNDPLQAVEAAARRFGAPEELSRELQSAVPWYDRWEAMLDQWFGLRASESVTRWTLRFYAQITLPLVLFVFLVMATEPPGDLWWMGLRVLAAVAFFSTSLTVLVMLLYYRARDALFGVFGSRKSLHKLLLFEILTALTVTGGLSACIATIMWDLSQLNLYLVPCGGTGIIFAIGALLLARYNGPNEIRDAMWGGLNLEA